MALNLPTQSSDVTNRAKVDVRREIAQSDPFLARSYLGAIITGICNRVYEFYLSLTDAELEVTPLRATRQLQAWASSYGFSNLPGSRAIGTIWIDASDTGLGTEIPAGTLYVTSSGAEYEQAAPATLANVALPVTSASASGGIASLSTTNPHNLGSNAVVSISGANEPEFNLSLVAITVTGENSFTYEAPGATGSATGTLSVDAYGAAATIEASEAGTAGNLPGNSSVDFAVAIPGVVTEAQAGWLGIANGSDDETDEEMRARLISNLQNPVANFNANQIDRVCRTVPGVTRTFISEATPANGQVTIYFMRDNDAESPIPTAADTTAVTSALESIRPASMAPADMIVNSPALAALPASFTFVTLSPDTATMRTAIQEQLAEYFSIIPEVGVAVTEDAYKAAVFNTIDTATGDTIVSFSISETGAVTPTASQIVTLGTVDFTGL